jgi:hypothetical protein
MKYQLVNSDGKQTGEISLPIWQRLTRNLITKIENEETKKYNQKNPNDKTLHIFLFKYGEAVKAQKPEIFDEFYKEEKAIFICTSNTPEFKKLDRMEKIKRIAELIEWEIEDVEWMMRQITNNPLPLPQG